MPVSERVFKYPLAALLTSYEWEERILAGELARARDALGEQQRVQAEVSRTIAAAQTRLRELCKPNARFSPAQREMLVLFLREQQQQAAACERAVAKVQKVCDDVLANVEAKRRQIKTLERHRERKQRQRDGEQARAAFRAADESWLLRRGAK